MKLLTTLRTYKNHWFSILRNDERYTQHAMVFLVLLAISGGIWFIGPHLTYQGHAFLAQPEKRLYTILAVYLLWILKTLIMDIAFPSILQGKDPETRRHLNALIKRFRGAMSFMKEKNLTQQDIQWQILIGPAKAGKTALLAHSRVPFILQRHFKPALPEHFQATENCDWWLTRQGGLMDVPSRYLIPQQTQGKRNLHALLWSCFLSLIKRQGSKKNINGITMALPIVEWVDQPIGETLSTLAKLLARRVNDIEAAVGKKLPCNIVITKCDLIPGFNEFFAESSDDDITQAWGITLPRASNQDEFEQHYINRFNALIKKLNQQLIWRLHHERNPMARPYIKDFPLQMEKIKDFLSEFCKELNSHQRRASQPVYIHGIYLTSALQAKPEPESAAHVDINQEARSIQIFAGPTNKSRAYFIKQLITENLFPSKEASVPLPINKSYARYAVYAASASAIIVTSLLLGRDFRIGMEKTQHIKNNLMAYNQVLQQFHNPDDSMLKTLVLLDTLQKAVEAEAPKNIWQRVMNYYSDKSQQNAERVYRHALQAFLMPEIKNYLGDYLTNPINKDIDSLYSVLKAYLMLGDASHFDPAYVSQVLTGILPEQFNATSSLVQHFEAASAYYQPQNLNASLISETRKYLSSLRGVQIGYTILKTLDSNTHNSPVLSNDNPSTSTVFNVGQQPITVMFTGKNFMNVYDKEIQIAAQEASVGNWILGKDFKPSSNPTYAAELTEELRNEYIRKYVDTWETALENIRLDRPHDLQQADAMIVSLTSYDSPLIKLLNIIHENTYFSPVAGASPKLQTLGQLVSKDTNTQQAIFSLLENLQALHEYLQPVLSAEDPKQAAFKLISERMQHQGTPDPLTRLHMAADQSPMPVKAWINQLSNDTWRFLLRSAMQHMDTSWAEQVLAPYQSNIANRYPFNQDATDEVAMKKFTHFFGKPGVITSFYNQYLTPFIDTSKPEWQWKKLDGQPLPFSPNVLKEIQQAMQIHHAFFPNGDDNVYIPFALQQQKLASNVQSVKVSMNNKVIVDSRNKQGGSPYVMAWPHDMDGKYSSIELTLSGKKPIAMDFPGTWGWFRLVNQTLASMRSNKEVVLNFSKDTDGVQYLLSTQSKTNPFLALNLNRFTLERSLTTMDA